MSPWTSSSPSTPTSFRGRCRVLIGCCPDPRMDRLHGSICWMVEEATQAEEDPAVTFVRVRELAETMAGLAHSASHRPQPLSGRRRPPRLTEPWFC